MVEKTAQSAVFLIECAFGVVRDIRNLNRRSRFCCRLNPLLVSIDSFRSLPAMQDSSASSIVATPHWGDCSFSDDLTSDGISATGCPQRFAHWATAPFAPLDFGRDDTFILIVSGFQLTMSTLKCTGFKTFV